MMAAVRRLPVVVILGATGTGKSKLAIEIGQHFRGEIISADSMQLYKGLDIITNKVTAEEQGQCPHHLLSVLNPLSSDNTVLDFRNMALPLIESLLEEKKVPIIVGGTNYYIEALLWNFLIDSQTAELVNHGNPSSGTEQPTSLLFANKVAALADEEIECSRPAVENGSKRYLPSVSEKSLVDRKKKKLEAGYDHTPDVDTAPSSSSDEWESHSEKEENIPEGSMKRSSKARQEKEGKFADFDCVHLHKLLQKVDPESAKRLHPKNRRKVVRALHVFDNYGVPMSQIHQAQHSNGNTSGLSGALRFPHCCVFWLQSEKAVLDERLDKRVDSMLSSGLVSELHALHSQYLDSVAARNGEPDYTLGIFQSIGFKEFHEYLVLSPEKRETSEGKELLQKGVEALKLATRQYARRQIKWIKNRFLKGRGRHVPAVYNLDSTNPSQWSHNVLQPAIDILSAVISGVEVPVQPMSPDSVPSTVHTHNVCDVCDGRVFTTLHEWEAHMKSRKHKKMLQHKLRKERRKEREHSSQLQKEGQEPA